MTRSWRSVFVDVSSTIIVLAIIGYVSIEAFPSLYKWVILAYLIDIKGKVYV